MLSAIRPFAVFFMLGASPALAVETLKGEIWAYVHPDDGYAEALDSVLVAEQRVRLDNIDNVQMSDRDARRALRAIDNSIGGKTAVCRIKRIDEKGRLLGTCKIGQWDVGEIFIKAGYAFAR